MFETLKRKFFPEEQEIMTRQRVDSRLIEMVDGAPKVRSYANKDIEMIHDEFNCAGEIILQEAENIIASAPKLETKKIDRLRTLGFNNVPQVSEANLIQKQTGLATEISERIMKYKVEYPGYKFITKDMVTQICEKYNLVCGDLGRFEGFVPEDNITEIERFRKKYPKLEKIGSFTPYGSRGGDGADDVIVSLDGCDFEFDTGNGSSYTHVEGTNKDGKRFGFIQRIAEHDGVHFFGDCYLGGGNLKIEGLQICAPLKDMNTKGLTLKGKFLVKEIPDPVVIQPIEGGYLVLTAWGDEASDALVVDQQMN